MRIVGPIYCSGSLVIGDNCWIGKNFTVNGNGSVKIGDDCDIGPEVTFETGGHAIGNSIRRAGEGQSFVQSVGRGTWIGGRATFVNDASVGESSVIAACACVTGSLPANCLAGGVPARGIAFLSERGEKLKQECSGDVFQVKG
ncbi:MAG: acyltransferase [Mailhella sp.]|nr:acyltransferase [Mailhella sp.]